MPLNRNALIRYKTIDNCLQNSYRRWTLEDLIDACSDALYEFEGITEGVSKRTVQLDIQTMRSEKLGYNAPIIVVDRKYYTYEDPEYSITNIPLTSQDLGIMNEATEILKQFKGFSHFQELGVMVQKLEDKVYAEKHNSAPVIDIETNENLKGLEYLDRVYKAILKGLPLEIEYQSFTAKDASIFLYYPYLLKEYNNRWFILGQRASDKQVMNLALDRIHTLNEKSNERMKTLDGLVPQNYYNDVIGVTVNKGLEPQKVQLFVQKEILPYILTKPLHHTQIVKNEKDDGSFIEITVIPNFELERELLSYGAGVEVVEPVKLRKHMKKHFENGARIYS